MSGGDNDPSTNSLLSNLIREEGIDQITASEGENEIDLLGEVDAVLKRQPSYEQVGSSNP